jgi:TPR repeat protein
MSAPDMTNHQSDKMKSTHAATLEQLDFAELKKYVQKNPHDAEAVYQLGYTYYRCREQDPDYINLAIKQLTKAANLGHTLAHLQLANIYQKGEYAPKALVKATDWLMKAALIGDRRGLDHAFKMFSDQIYAEDNRVSPEETLSATRVLTNGLLKLLKAGIPLPVQNSKRPIGEDAIETLQNLLIEDT